MKQLVFFVLRDGQQVYNRAHDLFATSVQDMQSGLWQYKTFEDLKVLEMARLLSEDCKEKTREAVLSRKINSILREAGFKQKRNLTVHTFMEDPEVAQILSVIRKARGS